MIRTALRKTLPLVLAMALLGSMPLAGCATDGFFEEAGEEIDEAADDAADAVEDVADGPDNALEEAADDAGDAIDDVEDELD